MPETTEMFMFHVLFVIKLSNTYRVTILWSVLTRKSQGQIINNKQSIEELLEHRLTQSGVGFKVMSHFTCYGKKKLAYFLSGKTFSDKIALKLVNNECKGTKNL